jgi:PhzF family phenazine biosynthesis protein
MTCVFAHVDSFTDKPFTGNPAVVCLLEAEASYEWMQKVATETNVSDTAFVYLHEAGADGYRLRWFTPAAEVALCGHATLASAHLLWEDGVVAGGAEIAFSTRSGRLAARRRDGQIELDFPADTVTPREPPEDLAAMLGIDRWTYVGRLPMGYLVELESEEAVRRLAPDQGLLSKLPGEAVVVTSVSSSGEYDFVSRLFAPSMGIPEDPVTGSSHCSLGPYWGERLNKSEMVGFQASQRSGYVRVRLSGERVLIAGSAVTVVHGELRGQVKGLT